MQDLQARHQMALNVERWKVPEAWFTPSMAGVDCAGLGEIIGNILGSFTVQDRVRLAKVSVVDLWRHLQSL